MSKIKIPEGMLKAAQDALIAGWKNHSPQGYDATVVTEAALLWQRENVQRPTDREFGELVNACRESIGKEAWEKSTEWMRAGVLCHEWIRRMYDAPEPNPVVTRVKETLTGCTLTAGDAVELMDFVRSCARPENTSPEVPVSHLESISDADLTAEVLRRLNVGRYYRDRQDRK